MIEKVTKVILALILILSFPLLTLADGELPSSATKSKNFSKKTFSKENSWSKNGKALAPPDPNQDGWGNTSPISGSLTFLILGSVLYLVKRVKDEQE